MSLRLVVDVSTEPVTNAEARDWAKMSSSEPDWIVDMLISSARMRAEHIAKRSFTTKTWDLVLDAFPAVELSLERYPVASVTHVKYLNDAGTETTLDAANYTLDAYSEPAFIIPVEGFDWPSTIDAANAVRVRFVEGWGSDPVRGLALVRQYMNVVIATDNEFRQSVIAGVSVSEMPGKYYDRLLDPVRNLGR